MSIELKIKAKTLAAEARIIRREEIKRKRAYHRGVAAGYEEEAQRELSKLELIHDHRVRDVREEARQTHLARAFLKGTPYQKLEANRHAEILRLRKKSRNISIPYNFEGAAKMIRLYGPSDLADLRTARAAIVDWVTADG